MCETEQVHPADLREGDMIDLVPLLDEAGAVDTDETVRFAAECEYAVVEGVEYAEPWSADPSQRLVVIFNNICNIAVPEKHQVTRAVA